MNAQTVGTTALANGRDVITTLKGKARDFKTANLPKAASAAESAGKAISGFALSGSRSVADSLRRQQKGTRRGNMLAGGIGLFQTTPLLRSAGRFAMRNPALLLTAAGVAIAFIGYTALKRQDEEAAGGVDDPASPSDD